MQCHDLPIILLAAGASRRMRGRDKLREEIDGKPLLRLQAQKAMACTTGPVLIALPSPPHPRYDVVADLEVQTLPVPDAAEGMNASLRRAFAALPKDATCAMLLLADLPDLTVDDLNIVAQAVDLKSENLIWRGTTQEGAPGHPIVFHAQLFEAFARLTGDSGGRDVIAQAKGRIAHVPLPGARARADLDTPEAWEAWRAARL